MSFWFIIPACLGMAITLAIWTTLRLILWSRAMQNIAGAITLIAIALVMMGFLYQLVVPDLRMAQFWLQMQGVGYILLYPAWFVFILCFTGDRKLVTPILVTLLVPLALIPLILLFIPATSDWFIRTGEIVSIGPFVLHRGEIGWFAIVYGLIGQVEGAISAVFLVRQFSRVRPGYRAQIGALFLALVTILFAGWMEFNTANPIAPLSTIALALIPICMIVSWVIFSLRVGQVLPVIRERVVENMHDSVLVLDGQLCVSYLNPAALRLLGLLHPPPAATPLARLSPELYTILAAHPTTAGEQDIETVTVSIGEMVYSVSRSVLEDWKGEVIGQSLSLRNITDHERMEKALHARASELARLNVFTEALSQVAARISASTGIEQVYRILMDELERMGIHFYVALRTPGEYGYSVRYISLRPVLTGQINKLGGVTAREFRFPEFEVCAQYGGILEAEGAIYFARVLEPVKLLFQNTIASIEPLLKAMDITSQSACYVFRLSYQAEEMGIFGVWGESLRHEDFSALSIFAAQVSAAIQKVRLIDNEQQRIADLERANSLMTILSQVAARFEADLDLEQIMETIGAELHYIGADCVIALADPHTDELVGRYVSVSSAIWSVSEKISGARLEDFRMPYKAWQSLNPQSDCPAYIIEDPLGLASKVMPLPKTILKQSIRLVGITPERPAVWTPLSARGRIIGILILWGIPNPQAYLPAITLFARQVASAIEKARLIGELEKLKSFNEGIVQGVAESIIIFSPAGEVSFANPAAARLWGREAEELLGQEWRQLIPVCEYDRVLERFSKITEKKEVGVELNVLNKDGNKIPVLASVQPRFVGGQLESMLVSLTNIEQRVEAEQQIRASMQEKEALLKEIHHRVKNNLQIISSLLNLQANQLQDQGSVEFFRESQNRIRSMALIHEKLYRSDNLAQIQFDEYIRDLGIFLVHVYSDNIRRIRLEVQAEPVSLDLDTAIPCSLIINELISNSLKHGFPPEHPSILDGSAQISVRLARQGKDRIQLIVEDNGAGFPPDVDLRKTKSLGLQLINSLTRQINGEIRFSNRPGGRVEIDFPLGE